MFDHDTLWKAIDLLAEKNGLSPSGLARKAGLSPTLFNPSKRNGKGRKHWPSCESIAAILAATQTPFHDFVSLLEGQADAPGKAMPLLGFSEASKATAFDAQGLPSKNGWDETRLAAKTSQPVYVLDIDTKAYEPSFCEGDRIIVSVGEKPRRGDNVVVKNSSGEVALRQLGREGAQKIELLPVNAEAAPLTLPRQDILWMHRIIWASK